MFICMFLSYACTPYNKYYTLQLLIIDILHVYPHVVYGDNELILKRIWNSEQNWHKTLMSG